MLIPAILKRDEILEGYKRYFYTEDMMYESGGLGNWLPDIKEEPDERRYQYAIVDSHEKLIGYLDYCIDWYKSCAYNFGLLSFDRGNPLVGKELFAEMSKLIHEYKLHRIEWGMVGGNPVERSYDKFCERYGGTKHIFRDAMKDKCGNYRNTVLYEIINDMQKNERKMPQ